MQRLGDAMASGSAVPETVVGDALHSALDMGAARGARADVGASALTRSTATEVQRARIVAMLRTGEQNTFDFRRAGIMQSGTRIFELRAMGYSIVTVARQTLYDADGYRHIGVAVYALVSEPDTGAP